MHCPPSNRAGISLKAQHFDDCLLAVQRGDGPGWIEVHPQNYFGSGENASRGAALDRIRHFGEHIPISFHSVGLSLGSPDGLNRADLDRLARLCALCPPAAVSDHLSFSGDAHNRLPDLLPIAYTAEMLDHFATQIDIVQDRLGRQLWIENPARYLGWHHSEMHEAEFLARLIQQTGCGLLLDINNIIVTIGNLGGTWGDWIDRIDPDWVAEVHLSGHATQYTSAGTFLIDDHASTVGASVWDGFARFLAQAGPKPTIIEWDNDVPEYAVLIAEAQKADRLLTLAAAPRHADS
ncbi:MAG: DUF692 domain-containing protein [Sphingomonadales bacterium]|jgi:uncharacterized protein (UPF0276 family)|nr:DUF692 domain-containing protein [Sphingomonadales bacterium]MBK9268133.1 DUF692 domain-containing protein [Sphingomonadales bacterium]MBP6433630.1 DUF692 domain-containing protein [Sphingorhabdus sp.]